MTDISRIPDSVTFAVDAVEPEPNPARLEDIKRFVESIVGSPVEALSDFNTQVVSQEPYHVLVATAHAAYSDHYPLILSPDMIWLTIAQGFANHINLHAEKYRQFFVAHEGKKKIVVRRDNYVRGAVNNPWEDSFSEFSERILEHIGAENHGRIVSDFSTTGAVERAVSEIVLMDSMQSYFEYGMQTMCGIPAITLEGTEEDWNSLVLKVKALYTYPDLEWWLDSVVPIAEQFAAASSGKVDRVFWSSLYKVENGSGGPYISGWLVKLFPYLINSRTRKADQVNSMLTDKEAWGLTSDEFPSSLSKVPFEWEYYGEKFDYEFLGGLLAITQDPLSLAVRPKIGWVVREKPKTDDEDGYGRELC